MVDGCPRCQGTGFELTQGADGVLTASPCGCGLEGREDQLLRGAGIPPRYEHCALESFEIQHATHGKALALARDWVELWPATTTGLLFVGPPGTGKTHLAVGIARELIREKGARVRFHDQRELLKALQETFDAGSTRRETEVLGPVLAAEVLILDDLGAGRTTAWARDVMHDVIANRYNEKRPLIMTSNHPTGEAGEGSGRAKRSSIEGPLSLRDRLGDALMSRLYEMCRIVKMAGRDYRSGVLHAKHHF